MPALLSSATTPTTAAHLSDVITADMMTGVFSEVLGVLPVVIPAVITFIAFRKGISFVMGALRKA